MADIMPMPHSQHPSPHLKPEHDSQDPSPQLQPQCKRSLQPQHATGDMPPPLIALSHPNSSMNANNPSRRPPRKSTLTQQQKNQKRQRATQDQLMTLEVEFNSNPTPTALVRERIAADINMTERSVQIWFQNRRAKIKNIAKRSIENGEDCDSIPDSMRQYLALQAYGSGKPLGPGMIGRGGPGFMPYGGPTLGPGADAASNKVFIQHFTCRSLAIGSWRRVGQSRMDLVIFYSPDKACVTYYIHNDSAGYKIEYPFAWIKNITLEQGDTLAPAEGASQHSGGLIVELTRPPKFFMDSSDGSFYECGDFTENQQASQIMVHHLGGPSKVLSGQLAKLVSLETYINRFNMLEPATWALSAPVSPIGHRPASQPNHMMHPHSGMHSFALPDVHPGLMGPPGPRGHKRQRSRSVPVAVDFSMLRQPMPSFLIQHDGHPAPPTIHDPNIFAPVPQHQGPGGFGPGGMGPHLSIDTSGNFAMMPFNAPQSATSAASPSDFGPPSFFPNGSAVEGMHPATFPPTFNGFLAVDPGAMIGTSNTPISVTSHGDPVIADHSPPLNGPGRSQSADFFGSASPNQHLSDDAVFLPETFNKQLALPFRSPMTEDASFHSPMPDGMFSFQSPPHSGLDAQNPNLTGPPSNPNMSFHQSSPHSGPDGGVMFQSTPPHMTQLHQDSGIAFSTPSQLSQDHHSGIFSSGSPKDSANASGLFYHDSKIYSSPGQMNSFPDDVSMFQQQQQQHSPMTSDSLGGGPHGGMDLQQSQQQQQQQQQIYDFVDPHALTHQHS